MAEKLDPKTGRRSPASAIHVPGTCPELIDPERFGGVWSRGPYKCNRPIDRLGRCKRHATAEEKRAAKYGDRPHDLPQP